jgi:hypothetical protein
MSRIQIPKSVSSPADALAPSLLTTLPPEIRNMVYEALYHQDVHVLLHDRAAYRKQVADSLITLNHAHCCDSTSSSTNSDVERHMHDEEFDHGYSKSISLLQTCRQIYHEASGVLYGSNTFLFSRVLDQHSSDLYYQTDFATKWIEAVGSQISLVTRIHVDADTMCLNSCNDVQHYAHVDMLPLLRGIWANPGLSGKIEYTHSGRSLLSTLHLPVDGTMREGAELPFPSGVLNNLLRTLGDQDALSVKRYAKFRALMLNLIVSSRKRNMDGLYGTVFYHASPQYQQRRTCTEFEILEHGTSIRPVKIPTPTLLTLPNDLFSKIVDSACRSYEPVLFDLDQKVVHGLDLSLLSVCRRIRRNVRAIHTCTPKQFSFKMTTRSVVTDFDDYLGFRNWTKDRIFGSMIFSYPIVEQNLRVVMEFQLPESTSSEKLQIEVKELLHLFQRMSTRSLIVLSRPNCSEVQVTWGSLQVAIFMILCDIFRKEPARGFQTLPQLWINGEGVLSHAVYPAATGSEHVRTEYEYAHLDDKELEEKGYEAIDEIHKSADYPRGPSFGRSSKPAAGSLIVVWESLVLKNWQQWRLRGMKRAMVSGSGVSTG